MASYYQIYKPLAQPQMTRVLDIMPGVGSDQVSCSIRAINLSHRPNYEALSFCWGDPEPSCTVLISDQLVYIPKNLHDALHNLRLQTRVRVIWADGLSIDQSNNIEKAQQILLMKQIYFQASKVVVFLGVFEDTGEVSTTLQLIQELAGGYKISDARWGPRWGIESYAGSTELSRYPELNTTDLDLPAPDSEKWSLLRTFLSKPWFERVWVIQELSLAQYAEILVGSSTLVWQDLADACYVLDESGLSSLMLGTKHRNINCMDVFRWSLAHDLELDPLELADHARSFQATDSRDRIYGLLGLMEKAHPKYVVDYNMSTADVYAGFTSYYIDRYNNLDIFGTLHTPDIGHSPPNELADMPSWVTNWTKPRRGRRLITDPNYNASRGQIPSVRIFSNLLKVRSLLIDSVVTAGAPFLNEARFSKRFPGTQYGVKSKETSSVIKSWYAAIGDVPYCYATGEWKGHAFATTLLAGFGEKHWNFSSKLPQQDLMRFSGERVHVFKHLWWWLEKLLASESDIDRQRIFPPGKTIVLDQWSTSSSGIDNPRPQTVVRLEREMNTIFAGASGYTTFFATKSNWIGTGPINIQVGDLIYLLYGARTPFIVRKGSSEDKYQLLGEAYVHGLMFGEALQKGFSEEDLILY